jgi:hypothetical protein
MSRFKGFLRQYLVQMKYSRSAGTVYKSVKGSEAWRPGTHAELSGREILMMEDGAWRGGGEVSKLVNPMISCCSCPSLHQVPLQNRGMERTSAGATKDECRRYKGERYKG